MESDDGVAWRGSTDGGGGVVCNSVIPPVSAPGGAHQSAVVCSLYKYSDARQSAIQCNTFIRRTRQ